MTHDNYSQMENDDAPFSRSGCALGLIVLLTTSALSWWGIIAFLKWLF